MQPQCVAHATSSQGFGFYEVRIDLIEVGPMTRAVVQGIWIGLLSCHFQPWQTPLKSPCMAQICANWASKSEKRKETTCSMSWILNATQFHFPKSRLSTMLHEHPPQTERTLQRSHTKNPLALCGEVPSLRPKKTKHPSRKIVKIVLNLQLVKVQLLPNLYNLMCRCSVVQCMLLGCISALQLLFHLFPGKQLQPWNSIEIIT